MKRIFFPILVVFIVLTACNSPSSATDQNRQATFTMVENDIRSRTALEADFNPTSIGSLLSIGGQAQSGDDSRAQLDLQPDGTIVRLGPNTLFTLEELNIDPRNPHTRLNLSLGQIWIILSGGSLEVETPYGTGVVRGSYMSIVYSPQGGAAVTCLEGHCSLSNQAGTTDLTGGQASNILNAAQPPTPPRPISENELQNWLVNNPESAPIINPGTETPGANDVPATLPTGKTVNDAPSTYTLINNCAVTWHWRFTGPEIINVEIPAGQTVNGTLPPGTYTGLDWWEIGQTHQTNAIPPGGNLVVTGCPSQ